MNDELVLVAHAGHLGRGRGSRWDVKVGVDAGKLKGIRQGLICICLFNVAAPYTRVAPL